MRIDLSPDASICLWRPAYSCYSSATCEPQADGSCGWTRTPELDACVRDAGGLELRQDRGAGDPLASGVEAAIIADARGEAGADVPLAGPVLAADLARRAGATPIDGAAVASIDWDTDDDGLFDDDTGRTISTIISSETVMPSRASVS